MALEKLAYEARKEIEKQALWGTAFKLAGKALMGTGKTAFKTAKWGLTSNTGMAVTTLVPSVSTANKSIAHTVQTNGNFGSAKQFMENPEIFKKTPTTEFNPKNFSSNNI